MNPFQTHTGIVALLNRGNIDTDQIISKEHLKSIKRTGYGEHLFSDWRYLEDGSDNPQFELNNPAYQGASILVTGNNFGCGSSREHAVWAIAQYGFRAIIAPSKQEGTETIPAFADIFANNSVKNGLLLIAMSEAEVQEIADILSKHPGIQATLNLQDQSCLFQSPDGDISYHFEIQEGVRKKLLEGLDDIGQSEKFLAQIESFEEQHNNQL